VRRICSSCAASYPAPDIAFCDACGAVTFDAQEGVARDARIGKTLGDYVVVARMADGAMARVYEGRHPSTHARVAIKMLHTDVEKDEIAVERFKREYEITDMLVHPHIVKVLELGYTPEGKGFIVMEHLRGRDLGTLLRGKGAFRPARTIRLACQAALALEHAHSFGVIHRDLKPENIFLCESPEGDDLRLLDFGSVKLQLEMGQKLTAYGTTLGSPCYMSPEQAMGKLDVDHRTDVFAMAAVLHECATGKITFDAPTLEEILRRIVQVEPPLPSVVNPAYPRSFDDVVKHGLQKSKTNRTANAKLLATELLVAFGLPPEVERWAHTPLIELESLLAATKGRRS
jgi:serine/threonine protein kinase